MERNVQLISGAIDKAFKSGVYGVQEASQILAALGALQMEHYKNPQPVDIKDAEPSPEPSPEPTAEAKVIKMPKGKK